MKQYSTGFYTVLLDDISVAVKKKNKLWFTFWSRSDGQTKETLAVVLILYKRLSFSNKHRYYWETGDARSSESARLNYAWGNISRPLWLKT